MNIYQFHATALCPAKDQFVRDFYQCKLKTDVTIAISEITKICERFIMDRLYQEKLTELLKEKLPPGHLQLIGSHFGILTITESEDYIFSTAHNEQSAR